MVRRANERLEISRLVSFCCTTRDRKSLRWNSARLRKQRISWRIRIHLDGKVQRPYRDHEREIGNCKCNKLWRIGGDGENVKHARLRNLWAIEIVTNIDTARGAKRWTKENYNNELQTYRMKKSARVFRFTLWIVSQFTNDVTSRTRARNKTAEFCDDDLSEFLNS